MPALETVQALPNGTSFLSNGSAVYKNKNIVIVKDLIFGLSVWDGNRWVPLTECNTDDLVIIRRAIDGDVLFPWYDMLRTVEQTS